MIRATETAAGMKTDNQNSVVRTATTARDYGWAAFRQSFRKALLGNQNPFGRRAKRRPPTNRSLDLGHGSVPACSREAAPAGVDEGARTERELTLLRGPRADPRPASAHDL